MIETTIGAYRIVAKLGEGGMGEVYRARDSKLNRDVAIKVLPAAFATDIERLARFTREAQSLAALNHPNIATIYGVEESGAVRALVMELVEGEDLSRLIARGPLALDEALPIARQIADALEAAHEQGIVHRDLKPANIKVRPDGTVKVLDFGLAKAMDPVGASSADALNSPTLTAHATQLGVILGTAAYMAPEQARGKAVDRRADIWAFGVVLYEMLTGRRTFDGDDTSDVLAAVLRQEIDWTALPADTPSGVRRLLERCLDRDVRQRLRDIGEARVALGARRDAEQSSAATAAPALPPATSHRPQTLRLLTGAIVVAAAASGAAWWATRQPASQPAAMPIAIDVTRVTSDAGLTTEPAVSPSGSLLAYASDRGSASLNVWVQPLPAGQPVQVTHDGTDAHEPSFSPDGSRLVFRSERDGGGIYVVPSLGGAERLVAAKGSAPRYSPDGRRVAYQVGGRGSRLEVWVVDEAGGVPRRLGESLEWAGSPVWSPDGSALVVLGSGPGGDRIEGAAPAGGAAVNRLPTEKALFASEFYRVDVATGAAASMGAAALFRAAGVAAGVANTTIGAWVPGAMIVSSQTGDSESLWSVGVSPDGQHVVGPLERLTAGTGRDRFPTVASAPDGRQLYFASLDTRANLYRLPLDVGAGRPTGEPRSLTDAAAFDEWPTISADGKLLVFSSDRESSGSAWLKNLDTLGETRIGPVASRVVNISPDGGRVVYSTGAPGSAAFVVRPIAGGSAARVPGDMRSDLGVGRAVAALHRRRQAQQRRRPGPRHGEGAPVADRRNRAELRPRTPVAGRPLGERDGVDVGEPRTHRGVPVPRHSRTGRRMGAGDRRRVGGRGERVVTRRPAAVLRVRAGRKPLPVGAGPGAADEAARRAADGRPPPARLAAIDGLDRRRARSFRARAERDHLHDGTAARQHLARHVAGLNDAE